MTNEEFISLYTRICDFMECRDCRELHEAFPDPKEQELVQTITDNSRIGKHNIWCGKCRNRTPSYTCNLHILGKCSMYIIRKD